MRIAIMAVPILMAITVHELAHGWVAFKLGDNTAKNQGRLSFNPLKHLDPVGTMVFLVTQMIGWAKPVPVNPMNLRNPKKDMIWVALAGPLANLALAIDFSILLFFLVQIAESYPLLLNWHPIMQVATYGVMINIGLAVFNLIPIPPLDGSNILLGLLPRDLAIQYDRIRPYGFMILLILIFTNAINILVFPVIYFARDVILFWAG